MITPEPRFHDAHVKAQTLIESLPWLLRFGGHTVVVKLGGNAMVSDDLLDAFAADMVYLRTVGVMPVIVHGGGPQISEALTARGIESEFRGGYRVTSTEAIPIVRDVLREEISADVVERIERYGVSARALNGFDEGLFQATRRGAIVDGHEVDLGHVGEVSEVNPTVVRTLLDEQSIPVVSSLAPEAGGAGDDHSGLNVNADQAASALAVALGASKLILLSDVPGLYADWPDTSSVISTITVSALEAMVPELESGMIPKMTACLEAVRGGVEKAAIIDGRLGHSVLLEIFTPTGIGTEVVA
ncbi:acetylglutamate kinase [Pontimonas sp.]|jgi:acetylglutamate kinase|uniref:acetylglutamate kinase n=1 Tax=Pontimonas sp. TaxID=2304492 RepID=UPI002870ABD9|nr:acetylglutamate kinase [Pontimonas sp.]MDR9396569.1 acetylglutamate kinase [Pontimonas sp.]MDR9435005.1 acetylglutamate kinase [Pontimonas sp.]